MRFPDIDNLIDVFLFFSLHFLLFLVGFEVRKYLFNYCVDKGAQNKSDRNMQQIILPQAKDQTDKGQKGMQIITISYLIKFFTCH